MKILEVISEKNASPSGSMGLTIFDIDDTLFHTTAQIKVIKDGKVVRTLTNQEFNNYQLQPEEEFDFGEFRNAEKFAKESEPIKPMINTLKRILDRASNTKVIMLTARADFDDKETFLNTFEKYGIDMSRIHVHRAGNLPGDDPPAIKKAVWVRKYLNTGKYNRVNLIDDSMSNLTVFKSLESEYPQVDFDAYFVKPTGSVTVVSEGKRRKKSKSKKSNSLFSRNTGGMYGAWGPGPYGGYGYDSGYSGDGGDGGGGESVNEKIGDVTQPVEPGDTVYSIARQNNLDPAELMKFNGFTINTKLKTGQEVKIPQKKSSASSTAKAPEKKSQPVSGQGAQPAPITGSSLETTLRSFAIKAGIKGKELAQFLAQCAHETASFATLTEFGDDFKKYDIKFNPQKAKALGNTMPGDGERFKGRGFIQLTGRWNYTQAGQALGLPLDQKPQLLERPDVAAKASVWFWKNRVQPNVSNFTDTRAVTGYINPGLYGLQKRDGLFQNYLQTMQPVKKEGIGEDAMRGVIYTKPNLEHEWPEANRYPEFHKVGKDQWIKIARQGSMAKWSSLNNVGNVDSDLSNLEPEKRKRAAAMVNRGKVELPIVGRWSNGELDLIAGNTRLATLLDQDHDPKVWVVDVPDVDIKENFADGKNPQDKGDSKRHGIPKKASISTLKSIRSSDTASPRKKQLAHWQLNMKQGRQK